MEEARFSGWWFAPLIALLGLVFYQPARQISTAHRIADAATLNNVPNRSFDELVKERETIHNNALPNGVPAGDPVVYFRFFLQSKAWEREVGKFTEFLHPDEPEAITLEQMLSAEQQIKGDINQKYLAVFGGGRMRETSEAFQKVESFDEPRVAADYSLVWPAAEKAYILGMLIYGLGILPLWIKRRGMKIWCEIPRMVVASLMFAVSWFVFPIRVDQTKQVKGALEFACGVLMLFFSLGGAGGSLAKAQAGQGIGKDLSRLLDKKGKRKPTATATLSTGISSELPSVITGSIFDAAPNLQTTAKIAFDNGIYVSATQWRGLNHLDPNLNMSDWVIGTVGYTHRLPKFVVTVEGSYMDSAPLERSRGDNASIRCTFAYPMGDNGKRGTVFGTVRELWKTKMAGASKGTYGYVGFRRPVPFLPFLTKAPAEASSELRLDPGNIGRGASTGFAGRFEFPLLPAKNRWSLRPFVGVQGPIWKDAPIKTDNRSWEVFGGATLAFSFRI